MKRRNEVEATLPGSEKIYTHAVYVSSVCVYDVYVYISGVDLTESRMTQGDTCRVYR